MITDASIDILLLLSTDVTRGEAEALQRTIMTLDHLDEGALRRILAGFERMLQEEAARQGRPWKPSYSWEDMMASWESDLAEVRRDFNYRPPAPRCPSCGKETTDGQLSRAECCRRCERAGSK